MNVLVTGGSGFLGSHLVEKLIKNGDNVVIIDNVCGASIMDEEVGERFGGVDVVFHLAALTRPQWSIGHPIDSNLINVEGTLRVFKHCNMYGVKRVVFVSSSSLYGENVCPTPEDAVPNPMSPYALQKWIGEQYAWLFEKLYGMEINCIRPFNVYGSRQTPGGPYAAAVPNFISYLNKGETPWITGDGNQARDFIYVDDVIDLMILLATCKEHGEAFNAGSGKNVSINNLYKEICSIMGKDVRPNYIPKVFEPSQTLADMSKVKRMFGWKPKVSLHEGLERTIRESVSA